MKRTKIIFQIIVSLLLTVSGIVSIFFDIVKDWLEDEVSIPLTFVTALCGMYSLVLLVMTKIVSLFKEETYELSMKRLLSYYGVDIITNSNRISSLNIMNPKELIHDFLYTISKSIHKGPIRKINYNNNLETEFYIYSLSAVHSKELLFQMTKQMALIIKKITTIRESLIHDNEILLPLLIVPFGRNILLGESLANYFSYPILIYQDISNDNFIPTDASVDTYEHLYQSFSGVETLEEEIKKKYAQNLYRNQIIVYGIIIDDNVTSGTLICKTAQYYNDNISSNSLKLEEQIKSCLKIGDNININFEKATSIATLFIAHEKAIQKLTENIQRGNLEIYYYSVLDEEIKAQLYNSKEIITSYEMSDSEQKKKVSDIAKRCFPKKYKNTDSLIQSIK